MRRHDKELLIKAIDIAQKNVHYLWQKPRGVERPLKLESLRRQLTDIAQRLHLPENKDFNCSMPLPPALASGNWDLVAGYLANAKKLAHQDPLQYKVVFFPYLDATWDALESVYEAFASDARFITDIVIIPAARNTPEGLAPIYKDFLSELHIPHTLYQDYDIESDKPDIVFVNNPYDQIIDPRFRIPRIRENCRLLVYVPYYGLSGGFLNKKTPKIFGRPIHELADRLIVQSELAAKAYEIHCPGGKNRYLPLGTPKIDSLKKKASQALADPDREWITAFAGRPVFLLDTHYDLIVWERALPDHSFWNYLLIVLEHILEYFARHKDAFLLWRPHPLTDYIIANYRNIKYKKMFDDFCGFRDFAGTLPNCLIDKSPNAGMAMALSGALISLGKSLRYLYPALHKPVIWHSYQENSHLLLPQGEQLFIDNNNLYYIPQSLQLNYFLTTYAAGGDIRLDESFRLKEKELLDKLDMNMRSYYCDLAEKFRRRSNISPAFMDQFNNFVPSPVTGYMQARFLSGPGGGGPPLLQKDIVQEISLFAYRLCKEQVSGEITGYIDMLAKGDDPLKEHHYKTYQNTIANSDRNCGQLIHQAICRDFFQQLPATHPTPDRAGLRPKIRKFKPGEKR